MTDTKQGGPEIVPIGETEKTIPQTNEELLTRKAPWSKKNPHKRKLEHVNVLLMTQNEDLTEKEVRDAFSGTEELGTCSKSIQTTLGNAGKLTFIGRVECCRAQIKKLSDDPAGKSAFIRRLACLLYVTEDALRRKTEIFTLGKVRCLAHLPFPGREVTADNPMTPGEELVLRDEAVKEIARQRKHFLG